MIRACCAVLLLLGAVCGSTIYYKPILETTSIHEVSEYMNQVLTDPKINWDVETMFGVINKGDKKLINPSMKCDYGKIYSNMPYMVEDGQTGLILFVKGWGGLAGIVCAVTYDIEDTDFKVALYSYNPRSYHRSRYVHARVFKKTDAITSIIQALAKRKLWVGDGATSWKAQTEYGVHIEYTQTDTYHDSRFIALVDTSNFNAFADNHNIACNGTTGKGCWKETLELGADHYRCYFGQRHPEQKERAIEIMCSTKADCPRDAPCILDLQADLAIEKAERERREAEQHEADLLAGISTKPTPQ
jgi:hypothetical protein